MMQVDSRRGWHVLPANNKLNREPHSPVFEGIPLFAGRPRDSIRTCGNGMHASPTVRDVLRYSPIEEGVVLCRVIVTGELASDGGYGAAERKFAGRQRVVIATTPFDAILAPLIVKYTARYLTASKTYSRGVRFKAALAAFLAEPTVDTLRKLGRVAPTSTVCHSFCSSNRTTAARTLFDYLSAKDRERFQRDLERAARKAIGAVV